MKNTKEKGDIGLIVILVWFVVSILFVSGLVKCRMAGGSYANSGYWFSCVENNQ